MSDQGGASRDEGTRRDEAAVDQIGVVALHAEEQSRHPLQRPLHEKVPCERHAAGGRSRPWRHVGARGLSRASPRRLSAGAKRFRYPESLVRERAKGSR
jgi:hypothetical protein